MVLKMSVAFAVSVAAMSCALAQQPPAISPREQLTQYVAALQKNPSDEALREKIIKLVLTLDPKPVVPREAIEREGAAEYAFKHVQLPVDFKNAASEYEKVLLMAPWIAGDYYNLGVCYDKAGDPQKAIAAFQLYLLAVPDAKDADDVVKTNRRTKVPTHTKAAAGGSRANAARGAGCVFARTAGKAGGGASSMERNLAD